MSMMIRDERTTESHLLCLVAPWPAPQQHCLAAPRPLLHAACPDCDEPAAPRPRFCVWSFFLSIPPMLGVVPPPSAFRRLPRFARGICCRACFPQLAQLSLRCTRNRPSKSDRPFWSKKAPQMRNSAKERQKGSLISKRMYAIF